MKPCIHVQVRRDGFLVFERERPGEARSGIGVQLDAPWPTTTEADAVVPWASLERIEAIDPWPAFRVIWTAREPGGRTWLDVLRDEAPPPGHRRWIRSYRAHRDDEAHFEAVVQTLFEIAERLRPEAVDRGWLDVPVVAWEEVPRLPTGDARPQVGGYRTAQRPGAERIVAQRDGPSVGSFLLLWLTSTPKDPWRRRPRRYVVTEEHLYLEQWDRAVRRLPLAALRTRRGRRDADAVYVFGRSTRLPLPHEAGCPVRAALDDAVTRARRR